MATARMLGRRALGMPRREPNDANDQPRLVTDLLRADSHPDAAGETIELRTTHASWVFLSRWDVLKVKRPVDLGFLDYRTLEARRQACEDEVRLNERLAPGIYLGVEPIRRDETGHHVGGRGTLVDWAVHMRRLPDQASAQALLAAGHLGAARLEAVARKMARFLLEAPRTPRYGDLALLRRNIEQNLDQSVASLAHDELVDRETLDEIWRYQDQELRFRKDRFAARIAGGRIRDGHGDLRLEHIYFLPALDGGEAPVVESPVVIDCVEFSQAFRAGDVANELAFLAMELEAAGRSDLAAGFVARSAEALDDFELYGVLDFYLCYRANVRAKVAAMIATDPHASHELRVQKRAEAQRDFALARACAGRPLGAPGLVSVGGVIGSGKSTLAAALGHALAAPVISSDRTRKALAGIAPEQRGGSDLYTPAHTEATYAELMRRAEIVLESGRTVILDATFDDPRWRELAVEVARTYGANHAFVEAWCPDWDLLRRRIAERARHGSVSDADDALLERQLAAGKPPRLTGEPHGIRVDTRLPWDSTIGAALEELNRHGISAPPGREYLVGPGSA
jgi:aminoglycoside phosphotransferase family enzyme/predicted kinase